jgi:Skp family chaperone for outer membrane proteins
VKKYLLIASLAAGMLAGCANNSPIGTVDIDRIVANWPVYQQYQQRLFIEEQGIEQSKASPADKQRQALQLQQKYAGITDQLTKQIRDAATKVAGEKNLKLVVTKQGVGYGGVDITPDVEKAMNITEKATPAPSSS